MAPYQLRTNATSTDEIRTTKNAKKCMDATRPCGANQGCMRHWHCGGVGVGVAGAGRSPAASTMSARGQHSYRSLSLAGALAEAGLQNTPPPCRPMHEQESERAAREAVGGISTRHARPRGKGGGLYYAFTRRVARVCRCMRHVHLMCVRVCMRGSIAHQCPRICSGACMCVWEGQPRSPPWQACDVRPVPSLRCTAGCTGWPSTPAPGGGRRRCRRQHCSGELCRAG